jgi:hypothetical protein
MGQPEHRCWVSDWLAHYRRKLPHLEAIGKKCSRASRTARNPDAELTFKLLRSMGLIEPRIAEA